MVIHGPFFIMKNRQVISGFLHLISDRGYLSDENDYSWEEVYMKLLSYRARVLSEKQRERGYSLSRFNYQTLTCVPIDEVDTNECPCAPPSGCTFRKTKFPIPLPIGNLQSVMSVAGNIQYDYIQWERFPDIMHSRFEAEKKKAYYTIKNTGKGVHLYVYNDIHKEYISVTGIFHDPVDIFKFPDCKTGLVDPCFDALEQDFILDPDLLPLVEELTLTKYFAAKQTLGTDILNNDQDDLTKTQIPLK